MKRILMGVFTLCLAVGFAGAAQSQVICSKTNNKGKVKFKLRDACKSNEVIAQDFAGFSPGDVVTTGDLPAAPGQLATLADIPTVRQTEIFHTTRSGNQSSPLDGTVQLDGTFGDTFSFATAAASTDVVITFSAECNVISVDAEDWVSIEVVLDGTPVAPTDTDNREDAFCTSLGGSINHYTMASTTVVVEDVPAGTHNLQVNAGLGAGSGSWWIGDVSLVVIAHED